MGQLHPESMDLGLGCTHTGWHSLVPKSSVLKTGWGTMTYLPRASDGPQPENGALLTSICLLMTSMSTYHSLQPIWYLPKDARVFGANPDDDLSHVALRRLQWQSATHATQLFLLRHSTTCVD